MSEPLEFVTWVVVVATITGPILAVRVQKIIEQSKEHRGRKGWVFTTLMATRGQRVSFDHVKALNMIDLAFYGVRFFGNLRRTKTEQGVIDTWHEYLEHLNDKNGQDPSFNVDSWAATGNELFYNLLYAIAIDTGYKITREQLKAGGYSPIARETLEMDYSAVRTTCSDWPATTKI